MFTVQKISNCLTWTFGENHWSAKWGKRQSCLSFWSSLALGSTGICNYGHSCVQRHMCKCGNSTMFLCLLTKKSSCTRVIRMRETIGMSSWRICRHCKTICLSAQLWQALSMGQIYITLQGEGKVCCCLERFIHTYKKTKLWSHTFTGSTSSSEFELFPHASPDSAFLIQLPWPSWPLHSHTF